MPEEKKIPTYGSRAQVYHGTAKKTKGGLTKKDLMKNAANRIVSKKKHALGKKMFKQNKSMMAKPFAPGGKGRRSSGQRRRSSRVREES